MKNIFIFILVLIIGNVSAQQSKDIHLNKVVAKLERNVLVTGIWVSALHPDNAIGLVQMNGYPSYEESMTRPMIDFILIDMEHHPFEVGALRDFLLALNSKREVLVKGNLQPNISVFVRIPSDGNQPSHAMIKQVLDVGVHGVVVPHVKTAQEAARIVSACRYPQGKESEYPKPVGTRGASPWICAYIWGLSMSDYVSRADVWPLNPQGDIMAIIMIEEEEGVQNISEILSVKGIGAVIFGPYDYSFNCGYPGETNHPQVIKTWKIVKNACDSSNIPLIGFANPENISRILKKDFPMLLIGHDVVNNGNISRVLDVIKNYK
jgi:4-hydroxy-2-oxoheptanedioate aldolase